MSRFWFSDDAYIMCATVMYEQIIGIIELKKKCNVTLVLKPIAFWDVL